MATLEKIVETNTSIDANGNEETCIVEKSITRTKFTEPDYIKIYTNMWCEFNEIPLAYRQLFLSLALRMTYCSTKDLENSQIVSTGVPYRDAIMRECGWTSRESYQKGLKELCNCGAIRRVTRGVYQINPSYAGKGKWLYDSKQLQGGVKDLVAEFKFKDKKVNTQIIWANDTNYDDEFNRSYRKGLGVARKQDAIMYTRDVEDKAVNE